MESNQSLFSLSIDPLTKAHLSETAKWARFLAIVGFIFLALMVLGGVFMAVGFSSAMSEMETEMEGQPGMMANYSAGALAFIYVIAAVIMFFPLLYLLRFANIMRASLAGNDQNALNASFQNLKSYFRYFGIITIIGLLIYAVGIIFAIIGMAAFA